MQALGFETLLVDAEADVGDNPSCECDCYDCDYNCEECDAAPG